MILTGNEIRDNVLKHRIKISSFDLNKLNPNSYDLSLGDKILIYKDEILDPFKNNLFDIIDFPADGYMLQAGDFILSHSSEVVGSDYYVPIIHAKSSIARLGLFVHITADLIDIGSHGNITFQIYATLPVKIYPKMNFGQVSFWVPKGEISLYDGKYQGLKGPIGSLYYKNILENEIL